MPLSDILAQILGGLGQVGGNALQSVSQQAAQISNPQVYAQQQENQRLAQQLGFQEQEHNTITPYEQQSLDLSRQNEQASQSLAKQQQQDEINKNLFTMQQAGGTIGDSTTPGAVQMGTNWIIPPKPVPSQMQLAITDDIADANPVFEPFRGKTIPMDIKDVPQFINSLNKGTSGPGANINAAQYESQLTKQLDSIQPADSKLKDLYKFQIHDALYPPPDKDGNAVAPDFKAAMGVLNDLRVSMTPPSSASPDAVKAEGAKAYTQAYNTKAGSAAADVDAAKKILTPEVLQYYVEQFRRGAMDMGAFTKSLGMAGTAGKEVWDAYLANNGIATKEGLPIPLDEKSRTTLAGLDPVISSLESLQQQLAPGKNNDTPWSQTTARALYGLGIAGDTGGLISQEEMDKIRGAAQAVPQGSRSRQTLEDAYVHMANPWKDSPKLMYDKLSTTLKYLHDYENSIIKYGSKSGVVQSNIPVQGATHIPSIPGTAPLVFQVPDSMKGTH